MTQYLDYSAHTFSSCFLPLSLGAEGVLCAFRGQEGLTTVFSQLKGAEQDALGAVIINTCEHCQNNGFLENGYR